MEKKPNTSIYQKSPSYLRELYLLSLLSRDKALPENIKEAEFLKQYMEYADKILRVPGQSPLHREFSEFRIAYQQLVLASQNDRSSSYFSLSAVKNLSSRVFNAQAQTEAVPETAEHYGSAFNKKIENFSHKYTLDPADVKISLLYTAPVLRKQMEQARKSGYDYINPEEINIANLFL